MKTSAIVCAVLAGTFGFSTIASAQGWRDQDRGDRNSRVEQRHDRREARQDRREHRRDDRREARRDDRRQDRAWNQGYRAGARQPQYGYSAPSYRYVAPAYPARFHRGGYLPYQYRSHSYYVNDWHAYPRLYAPPYGHQWVNVDGEFLLVAIATGLIANALLN
jgi:Ni/Co efflux regulator RcnB